MPSEHGKDIAVPASCMAAESGTGSLGAAPTVQFRTFPQLLRPRNNSGQQIDMMTVYSCFVRGTTAQHGQNMSARDFNIIGDYSAVIMKDRAYSTAYSTVQYNLVQYSTGLFRYFVPQPLGLRR